MPTLNSRDKWMQITLQLLREFMLMMPVANRGKPEI